MAQRHFLFYTHGLVGGGAERVWALLASGFRARGARVTFAVDFEAAQNRDFLDPSIPVEVLGQGHATAIRSLARLLSRTEPDAALAAVGASNGKILLARALSHWRGALILSHHGRFDAEHRLLGRLTYLATPLTSRLTDRTVVVSEDLRRYLVASFWSDQGRTVAIPNGIQLPPKAAVPDGGQLRARQDTVLAIGRLVPEKGMATIIEAMALSRPSTRLIILGEGPERASLLATAARLGLSDRVELRGYVADPSPAFGEAKVLVLASATEAFGNVVVEGLAHGLAVVATRCGGPVEILENGRHGSLVAVGDAAALAEAIEASLADPGDPAAHRARAEAFSIEVAVDRYAHLIEDVLAERAN